MDSSHSIDICFMQLLEIAVQFCYGDCRPLLYYILDKSWNIAADTVGFNSTYGISHVLYIFSRVSFFPIPNVEGQNRDLWPWGRIIRVLLFTSLLSHRLPHSIVEEHSTLEYSLDQNGDLDLILRSEVGQNLLPVLNFQIF